MVETRLKGDLAKTGTSGSLGHPEGVPQEGALPDEPGWRYYFHGRGCCLTQKKSGISIDVDFTREGTSDRIDPFFYSTFLEQIKLPPFPEQLLKRNPPLVDAWQTNIPALVDAGCLDAHDGIRVTPLGTSVFESLEPIVEKCMELASTRTELSQRQLLRIALELGDVILSADLAGGLNLEPEIQRQISLSAEETKATRSTQLVERLERPAKFTDSCHLAALADLGVARAKLLVEKYVLRSPVDGVANKALEILAHWDQPDLTESLTHLIEERHAETFGSGIFSKLFSRQNDHQDKLPRQTQIVRAITKLLQRVRPDLLNISVRSKILAFLDSAGGLHAGDVALLIYAFDHTRGLQKLRLALSGTVPAARTDAAAACVLLGTVEAEQILIESLENRDLEIQHTVMCALANFPSASARERASQCQARLDGIDSPLGKEVSIEGRTITAYNFEDVSHANMKVFFDASLDRLRQEFQLILRFEAR